MDWFKKCSDSYIFCIPVIHRIDNAPNSLCPRCKELFNFKCNLVSLILLYESAVLIPHIVATDSRALSALTSPNLYHILIYTLSLLVAFLVSSFTDILNLDIKISQNNQEKRGKPTFSSRVWFRSKTPRGSRRIR